MVCLFIKILRPALIRKFELKFDSPQVIGCVDGTHIPIVQTPENSHDYFCCKMKFSLHCQAICDQNGYLTDEELRRPGSIHDARVYSNSFVNKRLRSGNTPQLYQERIPVGTPVPQLLIGDLA